MRNSADHLGSADSLEDNQNTTTKEQINNKVKQLNNQRKAHYQMDQSDHQKADDDLERELLEIEISDENDLQNFLDINYPNNIKAKEIAQEYYKRQNEFGVSITGKELLAKINLKLSENRSISTEQQIKTYNEELSQQGKSQTEILSLLILKYQGNESVSKWVENWRNFLRLHQLAETKPPSEHKAIEKIMSSADFTDEFAFQNTLSQISRSTELSAQTKLEISREFNVGSDIDFVDDMDYQLKLVKKHTKAIEREIDTKSIQKESLNSEIQDLENELDTLSTDDPKRKELEEQLEQKKEHLEQTEDEIDRLEKGKPKDTSFQLREGIKAKLNPDGSRSIVIDDEFSLKLPSHRLPLTTTRNLRAINLAFPYKILKELHLEDIIFSPNIENGTVPNKSQRDLAHSIIRSLGIDDTRILSEEDIKSLKKSLIKLKPTGGKSGKEYFISLGVFDVDSQSLNQYRFLNFLKSINKG